MIQGLSLAGDVFWILCLAVMASVTWAAQKRIPAGTSVPVAWRGQAVLVRAPKLPALWLVLTLAMVLGVWLKFESLALHQTEAGAVILLGVRLTLAPLLAVLQISQVRRGLESLEAEGGL
ncbi:MAG: hypothetical protein EBS42_02165 [Caulobacteraceae bacterium]|nr:hypothetical protein [Caulobacteraceae bacterium]